MECYRRMRGPEIVALLVRKRHFFWFLFSMYDGISIHGDTFGVRRLDAAFFFFFSMMRHLVQLKKNKAASSRRSPKYRRMMQYGQ